MTPFTFHPQCLTCFFTCSYFHLPVNSKVSAVATLESPQTPLPHPKPQAAMALDLTRTPAPHSNSLSRSEPPPSLSSLINHNLWLYPAPATPDPVPLFPLQHLSESLLPSVPEQSTWAWVTQGKSGLHSAGSSM